MGSRCFPGARGTPPRRPDRGRVDFPRLLLQTELSRYILRSSEAMKLYYNPRSRAMIAKWMLDECGAEYEIVPVDFTRREHKAPEFLKINPAGKLPALVDGATKVFEGAAICLYLADRFPAADLEADQIGRAHV